VAWWGLLAALHGDIGQLRYFSQVTTLTVALTARASVLGFAATSPAWHRAPSAGAEAHRRGTSSSPR
jgi:hypothetical protein